MGLLNMFRRRPPIRDVSELADFIDQNAAFIVQKGMYEYSRARAGHYAKVLFMDPVFSQALEQSCWRAYPLGLAIVGEMVQGVVQSAADMERQASLQALSVLTLAVFDRQDVPETFNQGAWRQSRVDLELRLQQVGLHPPKRVMDIPMPLAQRYFELMPIHEKLRTRDFPTTQNYLKVTACNIYDELIERIDLSTVVTGLRAIQGQDSSQAALNGS